MPRHSDLVESEDARPRNAKCAGDASLASSPFSSACSIEESAGKVPISVGSSACRSIRRNAVRKKTMHHLIPCKRFRC